MCVLFLYLMMLPQWCQDSSASEVTGYKLDGQDVIVSRGRDYSCHHHIQTFLGAHTLSCPIGNARFLPRGKAAGGKGNHSSASSSKV
jgi:hypothetical protein